MVCILVFLFPCIIFAGGSRADYERAEGLSKLIRNKVYGHYIRPQWLDDSKMWYRWQTGAGAYEFMLVDAEKGTQDRAFDHDKLAKAIGEEGFDNIQPDHLPIEKLQFDLPAGSMCFEVRGKIYKCDLNTYELEQIGDVQDEPLSNLIGGQLPVTSYTRGKEVEVSFENRTDKQVELFWADVFGNRKSYGKIEPGQIHFQNTYVGDAWHVLGEDGKPVAAYKIDNQHNKAIIGVDARPNKVPEKKFNRRRFFGDKSPDGKWAVFVREYNVYLKNEDGQQEYQLTTDGSEKDAYTRRFYFSPDSKKLVVIKEKKGEEHKVYFVESSPADQVQPKLHTIDYHKPGDVIDVERPCLFDIESKKQIPVSDELFSNPYNMYDYRWDADSSRFMFTYNQRGHQVLRVVGIDAVSGIATPIIDETSKTFICYSSKYYCNVLDESSEIIWMSERDGWNHLYLYNSKTGSVKNQITKGHWVVRSVEFVDKGKRQVWFTAGGVYPDQDPYYIHYCRVNFDGSDFTILTKGNGTHSAEFSPDRKYMIDTYSRVDMPPIHQLIRCSDEKKILDLGAANWDALLKTGWQKPEPFVAKGRDGETDIYGVIYRPTKFDPKQKYPVIEYIYAGPHDSFVPKKFAAYSGRMHLAELGFIVVQIDGMGTSNRSKKFHDVCWKNLADAGLPDRIAWIKAAAKKYPYMDDTRVGIYGGSAGGQNAAGAVMQYGDFYKAAVADCGCHDNRMDKIWWNEQWMGWPVGPEYEANSNVTLAKGMKGKLLLIVGEMDRNVDPATTMQVVDALIKADKDFDLLVIPGVGHGAGSGEYGSRRMNDFFVRHLLGVEPRW